MLEPFKEAAFDPRISQLSAWKDQQGIIGANLPKKYMAIDDQTQTQAPYIVKYPIWTGADLTSVARELICARIGLHLFAQPVCPPFAVADPLPDSDQRGFGSKFLEGYRCIRLVSTKDAETVQCIDPATLARIIVFHVWLVAYDAEILIHENGTDAFSIDHGLFLEWHRDALQTEIYAALLAIIDEKSIEAALRELDSIEEEKVRMAFAYLPEEWLANETEKDLQYLARRTFQRKAEVRAKIAQIQER